MIRTERLRLEPLRKGHASLVFCQLAQPSLYTHLLEDPPASQAALEKRYEFLEAGASPDGAQRWLNWIGFLGDSDTPIGLFQSTVRPQQFADIAYIVFMAHQGRGFGLEMTRAMAPVIAAEYGLAWVQAEVDQHNLASIKLIEKAGFERCELTLNAAEFKGAWHNEYRFERWFGQRASTGFFSDFKKKTRAPWYDSIHPALAHLSGEKGVGSSIEQLDQLSQAQSRNGSFSPRFVQLTGRLKAADYHRHIVEHDEVPLLLDHRHDVFNALIWLTFPRAKRALMRRHSRAITARTKGEPNRRTQEEDALSHFDESGLIVMSSDRNILKAIQTFSWKDLFWVRREQLLASTRVFMFGHGLADKAIDPFVGLTGHALLQHVPASLLDQPLETQLTAIDERIADRLTAGQACIRPRDLNPFPMLGMPGWWPETESESFYDNRQYFRTRRRK